MRCLEYMKITEILRLKEMNLFTYRKIAESVDCSKTTVGEVLSRCRECGLTYSAAVSMTQDEINRRIQAGEDIAKLMRDVKAQAEITDERLRDFGYTRDDLANETADS